MSVEKYPKELHYNKDYSWVKLDDKTATIGIVSYLAQQVKEFVFIKLPHKGQDIKKDDTYVSVEAVKWSGHVSSPLSGKIIEVNNDLFNEPSKINEDPYGSWIIKLEINNPKEVDELLNAQEAKKYYEEGK